MSDDNISINQKGHTDPRSPLEDDLDWLDLESNIKSHYKEIASLSHKLNNRNGVNEKGLMWDPFFYRHKR